MPPKTSPKNKDRHSDDAKGKRRKKKQAKRDMKIGKKTKRRDICSKLSRGTDTKRKKNPKEDAKRRKKNKATASGQVGWHIPIVNINLVLVRRLQKTSDPPCRNHRSYHPIRLSVSRSNRQGYVAKKFKDSGSRKGLRKENSLQRISEKHGLSPKAHVHQTCTRETGAAGEKTLPIVATRMASSTLEAAPKRLIVNTYLPTMQFQDYEFAKNAQSTFRHERERLKQIANARGLPRSKLTPEHDNTLKTCNRLVRKYEAERRLRSRGKAAQRSGCESHDQRFFVLPRPSSRELLPKRREKNDQKKAKRR